LGVAPRRLWGWEPREVAEFEYDDAGRVKRSVTTREPEFDLWQVALLTGSHEIESAPRGPHGVLMSEATDPANQFRYKVRTFTDYAEKAIGDHEERLDKQYPDANKHGRIFAVELG